MASLSGFATIIAVLLSCMGLFGLISLNILHRTKEIGIRKVLGANLIAIAQLISKEFLILLGISMLITIPIVHFGASEWLAQYAYQIDMSIWIYVIGGLLSLLIALIVTSSKIYQAANANPVESLRYE